MGKWLGELEKNFYGSSMAYDKVCGRSLCFCCASQIRHVKISRTGQARSHACWYLQDFGHSLAVAGVEG